MKFPDKTDFLKRRLLIKPFIYKRESLRLETIKIICLLCVQILMLCLTGSYNSVIVVCCAAAASFLAEFTVRKCFNQKQHFSIPVSILQGILTGLLIPGTFSPVTVFFCVYLSMLLCKYVFGGFAYTWINPVVFNVLVLWFTGAALFPDFQVTKDILSMRNPSLLLIENGTFPVCSFDQGVTDFLNSTVYNLFNVNIPEGYISLIWDTQSVIPAFRFNFITIVSSLIIFCTDLSKIIIPFCFTVVYLALVRLVSPFFTEAVAMQGDMILALFSSGTLFTAVFVLGFLTSPVTIRGKIIYGIFAGVIAFLVAGCGTSSIGLVFSVLIADIFSLFVKWSEDMFSRRAVKKILTANNFTEEA